MTIEPLSKREQIDDRPSWRKTSRGYVTSWILEIRKKYLTAWGWGKSVVEWSGRVCPLLPASEVSCGCQPAGPVDLSVFCQDSFTSSKLSVTCIAMFPEANLTTVHKYLPPSHHEECCNSKLPISGWNKQQNWERSTFPGKSCHLQIIFLMCLYFRVMAATVSVQWM